jgi:hypothetical protein
MDEIRYDYVSVMNNDRWISVLSLAVSLIAPFVAYKWWNETELKRKDEQGLFVSAKAGCVIIDVSDVGREKPLSMGQPTNQRDECFDGTMTVELQQAGHYPLQNGVTLQLDVDDKAIVKIDEESSVKVSEPTYRVIKTKSGELRRIAIMKTGPILVSDLAEDVGLRIKPVPSKVPDVVAVTEHGYRVIALQRRALKQ